MVISLYRFLISFYLFFMPFLFASEDVGKQVRLEVVPQWYAKDKIKVYGQISVRKEFQHSEWIRYVIKPSLAYSLGDNWSLRGGLGLLYTDNKSSENINIDDRFEVRPFQGITYNYKISNAWKLDTYARAEERFDFNTETWNSINSLRLRLRLRAIYKFNAYRNERYYRLLCSAEGFSTLTQETHQADEKYRVSLGLERSFNNNQKGRIEVTWESKDFNYFSSKQVSYNQIYLRLIYYPTWGTLYNTLREQEIGWIK